MRRVHGSRGPQAAAVLGGISKAVVTGGAGFIGSRLTDRLVESGIRVIVLDNFSTGRLSNLRSAGSSLLSVVRADCKVDPLSCLEGSDVIFHLAGNPEVRIGSKDTRVDFEENVLATYRLLEAARRYGVPAFCFTSTSTVYGDAKVIPTPEDYSPLVPISTYGGSKLACEAMISSFSNMFSMRSTIFRFANVVGPPSTHGVVHDLALKLAADPSKLEVLGDGTQRKSYIYVDDCVDGMLYALDRDQPPGVEVFNLGSGDMVDVVTIAKTITREMGVYPELLFTGGVDGGRGWKGDVKIMQLDITKMRSLGWRPRHSSLEAVQRAARWTVESLLPLSMNRSSPGGMDVPALRGVGP
jgi:UDP-glucose 4-epimerase